MDWEMDILDEIVNQSRQIFGDELSKFLNYYGTRLGSKPLADIRQLHVQTAIADMLEAGRSSKSVREATGILQNY